MALRRQNLLIGGAIIFVIGLIVWNLPVSLTTIKGAWLADLFGQILVAIGAIAMVVWLIWWLIDEGRGNKGSSGT